MKSLRFEFLKYVLSWILAGGDLVGWEFRRLFSFCCWSRVFSLGFLEFDLFGGVGVWRGVGGG